MEATFPWSGTLAPRPRPLALHLHAFPSKLYTQEINTNHTASETAGSGNAQSHRNGESSIGLVYEGLSSSFMTGNAALVSSRCGRSAAAGLLVRFTAPGQSLTATDGPTDPLLLQHGPRGWGGWH